MSTLFYSTTAISAAGALVALLIYAMGRISGSKLSHTWQYYIWFLLILRLIIPLRPEIQYTRTVIVLEDSHTVNSDFANLNEDTFIAESSHKTDYVPHQTEGDRPAWDLKSTLPALWLVVAMIIAAVKITDYLSYAAYMKAGSHPVEDETLNAVFDDAVLRSGIRCNVSLWESSLIKSPMLMGIVRPVVIIPDDKNDCIDMAQIFDHELTHLKRHDLVYKLLIQAALCLHWFNPVIYMTAKKISSLCELSCDEAVLGMLSAEERNDYGNMLLNVAALGSSYRNNVAMTTFCDDKHILKERLNAIMKYKKMSKSAVCLSAILSVMILTVIVLAGCKPVEALQVKTDSSSNGNSDTNTDNSGKHGLLSNFMWNNLKTSANGVYDKDTLIAGDDITYNFWWSGSNGNSSYNRPNIDFSNTHITGAGTLLEVDLNHDATLRIAYDLTVRSGNFKIVYVAPDKTVTTIADSSANGSTDLSFTPGSNKIKIVGKDDASATLKMSFDHDDMVNMAQYVTTVKALANLTLYSGQDLFSKYADAVLEKQGHVDIYDIEDIAYMLDKSTLGNFVLKIIERQGDVTLREIDDIVYYMAKDDVNKALELIIQNSDNIDFVGLEDIAYYATKEGVGKCAALLAEKGKLTADNLSDIAYYMNKDDIADCLKKITKSKNLSIKDLEDLAYYMDTDDFSALVSDIIKGSNDYQLKDLEDICYYMDRADLDECIIHIADSLSSVRVRDLEDIAYYCSRKTVGAYALKAVTGGDYDISGLEDIAIYMDSQSLNDCVDVIIKNKAGLRPSELEDLSIYSDSAYDYVYDNKK